MTKPKVNGGTETEVMLKVKPSINDKRKGV